MFTKTTKVVGHGVEWEEANQTTSPTLMIFLAEESQDCVSLKTGKFKGIGVESNTLVRLAVFVWGPAQGPPMH